MNPLTTLTLACTLTTLAACSEAPPPEPSPETPAANPAAQPAPQSVPPPETSAAADVVISFDDNITPRTPHQIPPQPHWDKIEADVAQIRMANVFSEYDALLSAHVDELGFVNYDALAAEPAALNAYVQSLAAPELLDGLGDDAKLAALINAYNAFTLQLIVRNYDDGQLESITDLHGGKPWDQALWNLAGQTVSLNQLEHEMIRREFDEPRIHWAVVCAAYSCPPLRAEAYAAERLEEQLADQERRVLLAGDPRFIDASAPVIRVTQLFEWYGEDFGDWKAYVTKRLRPEEAKYGGFVPYNWRLNSISNRP